MSLSRYPFLVFFDKTGNSYNAILDENGIYKFNIHLDKVSVNLFENNTIYILEKLNFNSDIVYGIPHTRGNGNFLASWVDSEPAINLFVVDNIKNQKPEISEIDSQI